MAEESMLLELSSDAKCEVEPPSEADWRRAFMRPGPIASLVLHALIAFFLIYGATSPLPPDTALLIVPVDIVQLGEETTSASGARGAAAAPAPAPQQRTASLQQRTPQPGRRAPLKPTPPVDLAPEKKPPPPDELETKLQQLALLRQPDSGAQTPILGAAEGTGADNGGKRGPKTAYSVRDLVRAQVERRWNVDMKELGSRNVVVTIHLVMKRDGTVTKAEIVDQKQFTDATDRSIALSARNAVILSSPIALPTGDYDPIMNITLNLNPRNAAR